MDVTAIMVGVAILLVVIFDFTNGFHDTATLIATSIASRALRPATAVVLAAGFTFVGPLVVGTAVADTVAQVVSLGGLVPEVAVVAIACAMGAAVVWNIATWWLGLPSSSSHALVGALCGVALLIQGGGGVNFGVEALAREGRLVGLTKIVISLLVSPLLGLAVGFVVHKIARAFLRRATPRANRPIKLLQVLGTAATAFAHGANDAQKSMGVLTLVLVLSGNLSRFAVPSWVIVLCATALTLGTVLGGWRIVRTLGFGIYRLRPLHALDAQIGSSLVIFGAAAFGGPVSSTHVVSAAIMGVGAADRPRGVHWKKAKEILWTWFVTMPAAGALAVVFWLLVRGLVPAPHG